ncbi:hypothetical protein HU200_020999 [Digitaria exilis]|uniref:Uncharacterized protein n=1 Tax=Digitaria exilis TaxID=1010633 RepID=A0A835EZM4_9POAL|nr:hypothetical protein HU200_020999 [Digitaria exilis]
MDDEWTRGPQKTQTGTQETPTWCVQVIDPPRTRPRPPRDAVHGGTGHRTLLSLHQKLSTIPCSSNRSAATRRGPSCRYSLGPPPWPVARPTDRDALRIECPCDRWIEPVLSTTGLEPDPTLADRADRSDITRPSRPGQSSLRSPDPSPFQFPARQSWSTTTTTTATAATTTTTSAPPSDPYGQPPADPYGRAPPTSAYGQPPADPYGRAPPTSGYGQPPADPYGRAPPTSGYGAGHQPAYGAGAGGGYGNVVHVAHEGGVGGGGYGGGGPEYGHGTRPHHGGGGYAGEYGHETRPHHGGGSEYGHETRPHHGGGGAAPANQQTYRIYCKAGEDKYSLACRDGKVCLVPSNRNDETQQWIKDMKYSTRVKDEEGYPAIVLINRATGEALKHSLGQSHPSRDVGDGFRCIRMVNNIYLNFDALNGDKDHGGVRDGTTLVLWEWCEGDNQRWKIVAWSSEGKPRPAES